MIRECASGKVLSMKKTEDYYIQDKSPLTKEVPDG